MSAQEREAAVREWETHVSPLADPRKKKMRGMAIVVIAVVAIGAISYMKHGKSEPAASPNVSIAERKPVQKLKTSAVTVAAPASVPDDPLKAQREQMEMQEQARRMREARMKSAIIAMSQTRDGSEQASVLTSGPQDANSRFARSVSGNGVAMSHASMIDNLPYKVLQGKVIEAVLEPRAISDLPGMVCATVQRDVYGAQGRHPLIPWGSRVCGLYNAELRKGQDRLFVMWNTLRRPDGVQVTLDSIGSDQLGTAGMGGIVNAHFAQIFGMAALLSIIGAGASNAGVSSSDQYNSAAYYRQSVQQAAAQTSQQVLAPYANMSPTITVPAGARVRIYVNKDLDFTQVDQDAASDVTFIQ
jgi:type IV secretion system protein VirB10